MNNFDGFIIIQEIQFNSVWLPECLNMDESFVISIDSLVQGMPGRNRGMGLLEVKVKVENP